MRRSIVVLLLVTIAVMLVMAGPAFAKTGTKSGGYWAYSAGAEEFLFEIHATPPIEYVFASAEDSPHSGYAATTGKCKVCHAVHGAGIAPSGVMASSERLLRSTAADACSFCHLGAGAFAIDPYASRPGFAEAWDSLSNYYSNDSRPPAGTPVWTLGGVQNASAGRSGHSATHGHDNPQGSPPAVVKSYKGCVSCHAVHGANTMTEGTAKPNILKNDPAKGTTAAVGSGWGLNGAGYGSKYAPTTTQAEFCEDCHDGTKLVGPLAAGDPATKVTAIVAQADFNNYFPSCGANGNTGAACHNSVQSVITESIAQFGAFNNKAHNGRSHIMTTTLDAGYGMATNVDTETVHASGNGCATCHNVPKYSHSAGQPLQQGATFPHFWPSNQLIQNFPDVGASDAPCLTCHSGVGTMY